MSSGPRPNRLRDSSIVGLRSTANMRCNFASSFGPSPVSTKIFVPFALISRAVRLSEIRLNSSAGQHFSHKVFGTTPNMAPPSNRNRPSLTGYISNVPSFTIPSPFGPGLESFAIAPNLIQQQMVAPILPILLSVVDDQDASHRAHATSTARYDHNLIDPGARRASTGGILVVHCHHNTTGSRYVPNTSFKAVQISPSVALAFTASMRYGITFSPHEVASCNASTAPAILKESRHLRKSERRATCSPSTSCPILRI